MENIRSYRRSMRLIGIIALLFAITLVLTNCSLACISSRLRRPPSLPLLHVKTVGLETPQSSPTIAVESADGWITFNSADNPEYFYDLDGNVSFQYPPWFFQDFADGPFGSEVVLGYSGFELNVSLSQIVDSPSSLASAFIQSILNGEPGSLNCELLPTCEETAFSIRQETLETGLLASIASGPSIGVDSKFEIYFIRLANGHVLQLYFTLKDIPEHHVIKQKILASLSFK